MNASFGAERKQNEPEGLKQFSFTLKRHMSVFRCVFKQNPLCSEDVRDSNPINLVWNKSPEAAHCEILLSLPLNLKNSGLDAAENNYEQSTSQTFHFR